MCTIKGFPTWHENVRVFEGAKGIYSSRSQGIKARNIQYLSKNAGHSRENQLGKALGDYIKVNSLDKAKPCEDLPEACELDLAMTQVLKGGKYGKLRK